ncbi:fungal-specific transcription factor domain-domain-containing protein [Leucosporidium creatinivorum]|uniref:Fungal-specific transcription factor domain-domain-containing protein n=1 Tax=Leucosporidium creatinivorum TaxID=106004 RepID=A0A1Y2ENU2_9BASI|nr:fungal-specific transcription factor domain-domain-containing protein [Leucosporidium creatinivorum]
MASRQYNETPGAEGGSEDFSSEEEVKGKGKAAKDPNKPVKRRSSKACDSCRKSKCKCTRILDPGTGQPVGPCSNCITVGAECTYLGASRKRGPPKGYIEAIESRLHRMEALLGGLLQNDDPRAATLLGELIGNEEARDVLTKDLRAASAAAPTTKPRKSWKKADEPEPALPPQQLPPQQPVISRGFSTSSTVPELNAPDATPRWFTDEELSFTNSNVNSFGGLNGSTDFGIGSSSSMGMTPFGSAPNALGFDPAGSMYRTPGLGGSDEGSPASMPGASPSVFGGIDIPLTAPPPPPASGTMNPRNASGSSLPLSLSLPHASHLADQLGAASSPRQRRRLNNQSPLVGTSQLVGTDVGELKSMAYSFSAQNKQNIPATAINHTGTASYTLSSEADLAQANEGTEENTSGMSELADVVGQLSLNENAEVRYHGRSSGLYLISKSARYKDFFWQFPSAGVWPPTDGRVLKTEKEILALADAEDPLPDRATQQHLLDLYWTYVHPHFPILYKVSFMRQYRHSISNPNSTEPSTPAGSGKVPIVLLLSMFALAARYSDLDPSRSDGKYWTAGQDYLEKAKRVLNYDYGSSKLVSVQALLLMAYREIGTGGMSASWLFTGMAIRMAQDLGLFRDVEKWFLPVQRFSHEEKQTRKRVWWGCIILDRYTASYIGRPGTIHERDYDTSFPSEDEPDEHEQWRPIRPDGTDWSVPPKSSDAEENRALQRYPPTKAHTLSCFNAAGALAVVINRIIANIYAIRIRVLGQSSETLLSLLDQSLASWYLALPPHLAYNPASKKVPPPHVLSLHLQFYSALILLHRPFIPGQNSAGAPGSFPSHSICTTSANAIANIVTIFRKTFTLRQCPPFLTYPIFSAAVICVYNASFDDALAQPAKIHLAQCMNALKEMELIWGSAIRQWELLHGLVDLRDAELSAELHQGMQQEEEDVMRGLKRPAEPEANSSTFTGLPPTNFHARPLGRATAAGGAKPRRRSSSASNRVKTEPGARMPGSMQPPPPQMMQMQGSPSIPENATLPPLPNLQPPPTQPQPPQQPTMPSLPQSQGMFGHELSQQQHHSTNNLGGHEGAHQTYDILAGGGPVLDLSQFRSPPGTSGGVTNFADLLNSFLSPTEAAGAELTHFPQPTLGGDGQAPPNSTGVFDTSAFFGLPLGADMTEEWATYLPQAFFSPTQTGDGGASTGGSGVDHPSVSDQGSMGGGANHPSS